MTTTWNQIAGKWKQFRGILQKQWGTLTNNELMKIKGNQLALEGKIQEQYGVVKLPARPPD